MAGRAEFFTPQCRTVASPGPGHKLTRSLAPLSAMVLKDESTKTTNCGNIFTFSAFSKIRNKALAVNGKPKQTKLT